MEGWLFSILLFPLLGFLVNLFAGSRIGKRGVSLVACGAVAASFLLSVAAFWQLRGGGEGAAITERLYTWIEAGALSVDFALRVDPLSAVMILVVTGVGLLIHIYSVGYMAHDRGYARYFAYLNLFTFSMLLLVLGKNLLLLFVGWEGVGLCSYLLIGFWFERKSAAQAGKKAFIVNRIGDFGFLVGLCLLFWSLGRLGIWTLDFETIAANAGKLSPGIVTAICLLLFVGAVGKSAQIPLYVWLPDAMAGPTPVSALIHAATMVTAGVYLVARCNFLYSASPAAMAVVATIGAVTALFAATIALTQNDIKKVLAYSTVSQLGYMFLAVGVGAYAVGVFHLMTHAFFKALLFMGAGSVIHAMQEEQDIRKMGGLWRKMPVTAVTFLLAGLSISGFPYFAGFFSKDAILFHAYTSEHGSPLLWGVGFFTAFLTACYIFRLIFLVFFGKSRVEPERIGKVHESPLVMTLPLVLLALLSIGGGWVGIPEALPPLLGGHDPFMRFLEPVVGSAATLSKMGKEALHHTEVTLMIASIAAALLGIGVAAFLFLLRPSAAAALRRRAGKGYELLRNKYYVDEIYHAVIVRPIHLFSEYLLFRFLDKWLIDKVLVQEVVADAFPETGEALRKMETGNVGSYARYFVVGVIVFVGYFWFRA